MQWLIVLASATVASAQPPKGPGDRRPPPGDRPVPPLVKALDKDGDGIISATEIEAAPESLKSLDQNGDGDLTMEEIRPQGPPPGRRGPQDQGPKVE